MMEPNLCAICNKSFRGHDPLTDGKGRYFHKKCAPKLDVRRMRDSVAAFFRQHGIDEIQIGSTTLKTRHKQ